MKSFVLCFGAVGMLFLTVICASLLVMPTVSADNASTQAEVIVSSSCEMSSDTDTAHTAEVAPGIYRSGIGETTITTICNDANGYAIYADGYTNNEIGRNDMLGQNSGRTIATGTATSGDTSNWAMQLTAVDNSVAPTIATGYDAYHTIPDEYTKVVSFANSTMANDAGSKFKVTFASFVASAQAADTYLGKVRYTLVHPANSTETPCTVGTYTINYNNNGGSGSMDSQTVCVDRATVVLANGFTPPTPTTEYRFAAWNTAADGGGYTYRAGQSVANLVGADGVVTLYAQWVPRYMQDMTSTMCRVATTDGPFVVYDKRDGSDYTIRYIEGACWMTQNLRITGMVSAQYSNFSTYNIIDVCEGDLTTGNSFVEPRCHDSGNTTDGVWYNYPAATAKTIVTDSNVDAATEDICPAGWSLPGYDVDNTVGSINSLSSTTSTSTAKFAPIVGGFYDNGAIVRSGNGYWWSNTYGNYGRHWHLVYDGSNLSTTDSYTIGGHSIYNGDFIRCVRL